MVGVVYIPMMLFAISIGAVTPGLPGWIGAMGADVGTVGLVLAMRAFGQIISDVPGGSIIGRFGTRRASGWSFAVAVVSNAVLALPLSIVGVATALLVSGAATSITITSLMTWVRTTVPADRRGRALSRAGGALRIGFLIGPAVGGLLADALGMGAVFLFRSAALAAAGVVVVYGMGVRRVDADGPERSTADRARTGRGGAVGAALAVGSAPAVGARELWRLTADRRRALVTVGFAILTLTVLRAARDVILPLWGAAAGHSTAVIGAVLTAGAAFDLLLFIPAGPISDRFGRRPLIVICVAGMAVSFAILPVGGYLVAAIVMGAANGFGAGINMTTGTDLAPSGAVSQFLGVWRLYSDLGSAIAPPLVGAIAGAATLGHAALAIAAIGAVGAAVMAFAAPEPLEIARRDGRLANGRAAHETKAMTTELVSEPGGTHVDD